MCKLCFVFLFLVCWIQIPMHPSNLYFFFSTFLHHVTCVFLYFPVDCCTLNNQKLLLGQQNVCKYSGQRDTCNAAVSGRKRPFQTFPFHPWSLRASSLNPNLSRPRPKYVSLCCGHLCDKVTIDPQVNALGLTEVDCSLSRKWINEGKVKVPKKVAAEAKKDSWLVRTSL